MGRDVSDGWDAVLMGVGGKDARGNPIGLIDAWR